MIPYGRQSISESDIEAVCAVLRSDFLTQGPAVPAFEKKISEYCGVSHAVAVNSATSALHLACLALGVGEGDIVWTTPISFVASANCALYCGATVDFVDIDPHTYNMSTTSLQKKLEQAELVGRLPKVVIPVHLAGQPCKMESIYRLSKKYGFKIIEDASHAIGGQYCGEPIGNCRYSDICVFSFHPVKIITTAEGGMAVTNSDLLAKRMTSLRSHGVTRDPSRMSKIPDGPWYYEQTELGFNYRMTDLQAALGLSQAQRLNEYVARRHVLAKQYDRGLFNLPLTIPFQNADGYSGLHLYVIRINLDLINKTHLDVFNEFRNANIGVNLHYMPIYLQPYYQRLGFSAGYCVEAEKYYAQAISLPMYPDLTDIQQQEVIEVATHILSK